MILNLSDVDFFLVVIQIISYPDIVAAILKNDQIEDGNVPKQMINVLGQIVSNRSGETE